MAQLDRTLAITHCLANDCPQPGSPANNRRLNAQTTLIRSIEEKPYYDLAEMQPSSVILTALSPMPWALQMYA